MYQSKFKLSLITALLILLSGIGGYLWIPGGAMLAHSSSHSTQAAGATYTLRYNIERSEVPTLTFNDLTLKVVVGEAENIAVTADGASVTHTYDATSGELLFTTSGSAIEVSLTSENPIATFGEVTKSALKNNKGFAWSLGMDDNANLRNSVAAMEQYDWRGTFYLIGSFIDDASTEETFTHVPYIHEKLAAGWSIGNHGFLSNCNQPISEQDVLDGYARLQNIIASSSVPNYQITAFAAPCFVSEYHPIILNHRNSGATAVQFNESGSAMPVRVDPGVTENAFIESDTISVVSYPMDFDEPVGRGTYVEFDEVQSLLNLFDLMASRHANEGEHLWHNTLVHGLKEDGIGTAAAYLDANYGAAGTDQVWVAPSDQIYSYLLVRERSEVTLVSIVPPLPTSMPTTAPTETPLPTMTPAPDATATAIPSATPSAMPTQSATAESARVLLPLVME